MTRLEVYASGLLLMVTYALFAWQKRESLVKNRVFSSLRLLSGKPTAESRTSRPPLAIALMPRANGDEALASEVAKIHTEAPVHALHPCGIDDRIQCIQI